MKGSDVQTILIVDDEPIILTLLEFVLHSAGFTVLTAGCGGEAISISRSHQGEIALLITDITMPGMTGWTVARKLVEADPDIPVLFMSGGCVDSDFDGCGRSEFLAKPFSLDSLLAEVRSLLTAEDPRDVS
jgi:two-component system cell cycle sensor histidine kinase/response regulator CckA